MQLFCAWKCSAKLKKRVFFFLDSDWHASNKMWGLNCHGDKCGASLKLEAITFILKKRKNTKKQQKHCVEQARMCPCAGCGPPGPGSCLSRGGRGGRPRWPANPRHPRQRFPLLIFQLPLRPQPAAKTEEAGLCRSHEPEGRSSANEGAYSHWNVRFTIIL